jgi:hypothetical protein
MTQKDKVDQGFACHVGTEVNRRWRKETKKKVYIELWKDVQEAKEEEVDGPNPRARSFDLYNWHR